MTNPGGLSAPFSSATNVAPLWPKSNERRDARPHRDLQVFPRHVRETDSHQTLHRTAGVKHHLRGMANREEMLTTYEHDFAFMSRPKPPPSARSASIGAPSSGGEERRMLRTGSGRSVRSCASSMRSAAGSSAASGHAPLRLSVNGWSDTRWSPQSHPTMIQGMTQKQINLVQTANIMNLRAPDVPFVTR
mmetsp:Transcript_42950/g.124195  ORF Transcript_42950/g.124195 Transcript_42950/m.124195 type:complete len:190 (+) Transcript_42950:40-609(+)